MKARELRIGNLVTDEFYDHFKTVHKVESINEKGINLEVTDDGDWPEVASHWIEPECSFDKLRGIPLTEEWLLKFGFFLKEEIDDEHFFNGALFQDRNSDEFVIHHGEEYHYIRDISASSFDGSTEYRTTKIQYIHQLQNLYFALTGEELTIK